LKSARAVLAGGPIHNDTTQILSHYHERAEVGCAFDVLGSDEDLVAAFAWRTASLTFDALRQRDELKVSWNDLLVHFYRLSKAHSQYMIVKNFYNNLTSENTKAELNQESIDVLYKLFRLYALHTLESEASEFYVSAAVTVRQIQLTRSSVMKLIKEIRPHAVKLVDAWDFSDFQLDSSLGRYDGNVYEDLFNRASEQNPLNNVVVDPYPTNDVLYKTDRFGKPNNSSKLSKL